MNRKNQAVLILFGSILSLESIESSLPVAGAMGNYLGRDNITRCITRDVQGTYSSTESKYKLSGICTVFADVNNPAVKGTGESTFDNEKVLYNLEWIAEGRYTPSTRATREKIDLRPRETHRFNMGLESKMVCDRDPWRDPSGNPCVSIFDKPSGNITDDILTLLRQEHRGIPFTSSLNMDLRAGLNRQYLASAAVRQNPGSMAPDMTRPRPPAVIPADKLAPDGKLPTAISEAPYITVPAAGSLVVQGQFVVKVQPPRAGGSSLTLLEFTWLDTPPSQPRYINQISVDSTTLLKGYPVPPTVTRGQPGRWQLRAQVSGQTNPGPWSPPVPFQLALTAQNTMQSGSPAPQSSLLPSPSQAIQQQPQTGRPSILYGIAPNGGLKWYRHNGSQNGTMTWAGPADLGTGWQNVTQVIPGGGSVIYSIASDGTLKWYSHQGATNGSLPLTGPKNVQAGWRQFKQVFSGSEGILYAITPDGTLKWFRHIGYQDGAGNWQGPRDVGTGWQNFKQVFGMGGGIIYAISNDGTLSWYKHAGYRDGTTAWEGPRNVGNGWQAFKHVFGAGQGIIYAIAGDGTLKWYKHTGYLVGSPAWENARNVGTGWQGFTAVLSLLP